MSEGWHIERNGKRVACVPNAHDSVRPVIIVLPLLLCLALVSGCMPRYIDDFDDPALLQEWKNYCRYQARMSTADSFGGDYYAGASAAQETGAALAAGIIESSRYRAAYKRCMEHAGYRKPSAKKDEHQ